MSGVLCDAPPKERCVFCGSTRHQFGVGAHLDVAGMMMHAAAEMLLIEKRASWQSVWADIAAESWKAQDINHRTEG